MHHDILGGSSRFVTVVESEFSGVVERTLDGQTIPVTDSEKTLVDAADRLDLSGEIAQLARALQAAWSDLDLGRLDGYLQRWSTGSLLKRIGHLVECLERPFPHRDERLARWRRSLSSGIVALEPSHRTTAGRIVPHWRLRVNVEETWRGKLHPVMADRDRQKAGTTERRSRAASVAEEEELVAELGLLGIRYLSRQSSYQASQVRSPEQLLADLVRQPHARVRTAVIALLLARPEYAEAVPAALDRLTPQDRLTLQSLYTAAVLLQRVHADRLRPLVGQRWRWLPDLLSDQLGLPAVGAPREKLALLDREMRYRTGAAVNWTGTYTGVVETLIRDCERRAARKR